MKESRFFRFSFFTYFYYLFDDYYLQINKCIVR
nr:MAG TPA: hypothetical protein [Caudoviricetes sp.]